MHLGDTQDPGVVLLAHTPLPDRPHVGLEGDGDPVTARFATDDRAELGDPLDAVVELPCDVVFSGRQDRRRSPGQREVSSSNPRRRAGCSLVNQEPLLTWAPESRWAGCPVPHWQPTIGVGPALT